MERKAYVIIAEKEQSEKRKDQAQGLGIGASLVFKKQQGSQCAWRVVNKEESGRD